MIYFLKKTKEGNEAGFTLIETLVAIFVFSLMMVALTALVISSYRSHGYGLEQANAVEEARGGIDAMNREIRAAKTGDNGSYALERADDKQIVFYSDIDGDGQTERVRYFLGTITSKNETRECSTSAAGGTCSVFFSNLLDGDLKSGEVRISVDGDFDASNEYVAFEADGGSLGNLCQSACLHCADVWQGLNIFDVTSQMTDGSINFLADATNQVGRECPQASPFFSMKARFELSWSEEVIGFGNELKKGVIEPTGDPVTYPLDQEKITVVTTFIRNDPPIFRYYDSEGNEIENTTERLLETKMIKTFMVVNIDPNSPPTEYQLESFVQLRNLKDE